MAVLLQRSVARPRSCLAAPPNAMLVSLAEGCWAALLPRMGILGCPAAMHREYPPPCCDGWGVWGHPAAMRERLVLRASQPRHAALSLASPCAPRCPGLWARAITSSALVVA